MSGVFVCYRRSRYVEHAAGRLHDTMVRAFGEDEVFMDVDSLRPGEDWEVAIDDALAVCDVLLAVIDPEWIGDKRLRDADDVLRGELERALSRDLWVVPVLVNRAEAPSKKQLPKTLRALARKQGHPIEHRSWRIDVEPLVEVVGEKLGTTRPRFSTADAAELIETVAPDEAPGALAPGEAGGEADARLSVFLSSSAGELAEERDAVEAALKSSNLPVHLWRYEDDAAASVSRPADVRRAAIERSDAIVVLVGQELDQDTADEIDAAQELDKPVLVYAKDDRSTAVDNYLRGIADPESGITARNFEHTDALATGLTHDLAGLVVSEYRELVTWRRDPDDVRQLEANRRDFVGRAFETELLLDLIDGRESLIVVHGPSGIGKKSLVRNVGAISRLDSAFSDGAPVSPHVGHGPDLEDLIQALWEFFYETSRGTLPSPRRRVKDLRHIEALVVLPDMSSEILAAFDRVLDAMPRSTFVVTTEDAPPLGRAIEIGGLTDEAELIALFEDRYRGEVPDDAKAGIVALCQAVDGHPGTIEQLAVAAFREWRGNGDATDEFLTSWVVERRDLTSAELRSRRAGPEPSVVDVVAASGTPVPRSVLAGIDSAENIEDVVVAETIDPG